jgi:predicted patatin/cPLA2 family phospholipase
MRPGTYQPPLRCKAMSDHPVARLLRERADAGSVPGARQDPHRVALVREGGGMRGVVSAGMVAALERLGMNDVFDLIVGSSAGAINGMALLSGVAQRASDAYCGPLASKSFVNPMRVLRGKPVIDVNDVLTVITASDVAGTERLLSGAIGLHCIATDVDSATAVDLHGMRTQEEVWAAILASSRMPWAGGPPVEIDGRRYLDGGMIAPVPVAEAIAVGATHVLALQTRPFGIPRKSASRIGDRLIERHLRGLNPALVAVYRERIGAYERLVDDLARRSREPGEEPPYVLGLRPPDGTPCVGQLERDPVVLTAGAVEGERLVEAALAGAGRQAAA